MLTLRALILRCVMLLLAVALFTLAIVPPAGAARLDSRTARDEATSRIFDFYAYHSWTDDWSFGACYRRSARVFTCDGEVSGSWTAVTKEPCSDDSAKTCYVPHYASKVCRLGIRVWIRGFYLRSSLRHNCSVYY